MHIEAFADHLGQFIVDHLQNGGQAADDDEDQNFEVS